MCIIFESEFKKIKKEKYSLKSTLIIFHFYDNELPNEKKKKIERHLVSDRGRAGG